MMTGNYLTHSPKMLTENCVLTYQYLEELVIFSALEREVHTRKLESEHSKSTSSICDMYPESWTHVMN